MLILDTLCLLLTCIFFLCYTEAAFVKKIQARGGQCGGKQQGKGGKGKEKKTRGKR